MYALEHYLFLTVFQASSLFLTLILSLSDCVPVCTPPLLMLHHMNGSVGLGVVRDIVVIKRVFNRGRGDVVDADAQQ